MKEHPMRISIPAAIVAVALVAPAAAAAHVTVQPASAPAGGFTRLDVRVPNERDDAGTVKVAVQLPPGIADVTYEPVPGWKVTLLREKAAKPIEVEGLKTDQQVARITWTGDGRQGIIAPGQFQDFGIALQVPDGKPGQALTFKALQTYQGGDVVRWIGPPDAEEPAPTVTLTAAGAGGGHGAPTGEDSGATAAAAATPAGGDDDGGGSDAIAIVALVLAAVGLAAGVAGVLMARSARSARDRVAA
jgi:uncharacterized protein YcnI